MDVEGAATAAPATDVNSLPDDVLGEVFKWLPLREKLRFGQVCRRWHRLSHSPHFWRTVNLSHSRVDVKQALPLLFSSCMLELTQLSLYDCKEVDDRCLAVVAGSASRTLMRLDVGRCTRVTDEGIVAVVQACRHLRVLGLRRCRRLTDRAVEAIAASLPGLRELSLKKCQLVTDAGVRCLQHCRRLEVLQLGHLELLTGASVSQLGCLPGLVMISLRGCVNLQDAAIEALTAGCPALERLDLAGCICLTDAALRSIAANCPRARMFMLNDCQLITDGGVAELVRGCPGMEKLFCAGCASVGDGALACFASPEGPPVTGMLTLFLQDCERVSDASLTQALPRMPLLRTLCLRGCRLVTGRAIQPLAQAAQLATLDLGSCALVLNEDLRLLFPHLPQLRYVSLGGVTTLQDSGVCSLAAACPQLLWLSLKLCVLVSDVGLVALAHGCPHLGSLGLHGCRHVTTVGLEELALRLHELTRLTVGPDVAFTSAALGRFARLAPRLTLTIGGRSVGEVQQMLHERGLTRGAEAAAAAAAQSPAAAAAARAAVAAAAAPMAEAAAAAAAVAAAAQQREQQQQQGRLTPQGTAQSLTGGELSTAVNLALSASQQHWQQGQQQGQQQQQLLYAAAASAAVRSAADAISGTVSTQAEAGSSTQGAGRSLSEDLQGEEDEADAADDMDV